ncbi:MAG: hypothetical protein KGN84_17205 [Acidobacteriota bacterium]|nr:hypothetical protein [Acidobacteriota bacterium]
MISPVSSSGAVYNNAVSQAQPQPAKQASTQDSVQLSPQALAAVGGDADHDGDSH